MFGVPINSDWCYVCVCVQIVERWVLHDGIVLLTRLFLLFKEKSERI